MEIIPGMLISFKENRWGVTVSSGHGCAGDVEDFSENKRFLVESGSILHRSVKGRVNSSKNGQ